MTVSQKRMQIRSAVQRYLLILAALSVCSAGIETAQAEPLPQRDASVAISSSEQQENLPTSANVRQIYRDQSDTLWIATETSVERLTGDALEVLPAIGGITS